MQSDLKNDTKAIKSLAPAALTDGTVLGTVVDLLHYRSAIVIFDIGAWTDGTHTPSLVESDDDSSYTAVAAGDMIGTLAAVSGAGGQNAVQSVGYKGTKRYIKPKVVTASSTVGAVIGAVAVKGHPEILPAA